jgi:hypothetical protein
MKKASNTGMYIVFGIAAVGIIGGYAYNKYVKENKAISFLSWINSKL